jgi:hypothetical protein
VPNLYCTRRDVNRWIPSGEITGWSRLAASALASNDTITLDGHGLETDDEVTVRAAEGGALPVPLVEGTVYYAIRGSNATFQLAATAGGAAINITADGESVVVVKQPPFDDVIEYYSRWIDTLIPAHLVPLTEPIHPLVKGLCAELSAKKLLNLDGKSSEIVNQSELAAKAQLERLVKGLPLRGAEVTASANKAVTATITSATSDPRGWGADTLP